MFFRLYMPMVLLFGVACSSGPILVPIGLDALEQPDLVDVASSPMDTTLDAAPSVDAQKDLPILEVFEDLNVAVDVDDSCQEGDGCFGDLCEGNGDCASGICLLHEGDLVCSKSCVEDCPNGWSCLAIDLNGSDLSFACVSNFSHLCQPCVTKEDCSSNSIQNVCVDYGDEGKFCGASCAGGSSCPDGYTCEEAPSVLGGVSEQCVKSTGVCDCAQGAVDLALSTECSRTNEMGSCLGLRFCTQDGLSDCDASEPVAEVCNGLDDDCDGQIDESSCDDGNVCTLDSCEGEAGCVYTPLTGVPCDDGTLCTQDNFCEAGLCGGTAVICEDELHCTDDGCDPEIGCVFAPNELACDDGNNCTLDDQCAGGSCLSGPEIACDDGNPCTDDSCTDTGCSFTANEASCNDGNACTLDDQCQGGQCSSQSIQNCDDSNVCTTELCDAESGCVVTNNDAPCTDGNVCTLSDECSDGSCVSGAAMSCVDGNVCTDDGCDPSTGCSFTANSLDCDDGNECTPSDACSEGACQGSSALSCDDGNPCTTDSCMPEVGCVYENNSQPCDDGNACFLNDLCSDGICTTGSLELSCGDGNVCTDDSCDPSLGCLFTPNDVACDDGNLCTPSDVCSGGSCQGSSALSCDDGNPCTTDSCMPDIGCVYEDNALSCEDGSLCTVGDVCSAGLCTAGAPIECNDGNFCNGVESCDVSLGCTPGIAPTTDDGVPCTLDSCDEDADVILHVPQATLCSDGDFCNGEESCDEVLGCIEGLAPSIDDGIACTVDSCDEEEDLVLHQPDETLCPAPGLCESSVCAPSLGGCAAVSLDNCCGNGVVEGSEACDDGNSESGDGCSPTCAVSIDLDITFTNCGASGSSGPNQSNCNLSYAGLPHLGGNVTVANGMQLWTVPFSGAYRLTVKGAQGGAHSMGLGGNGAMVVGDFNLAEGTVLKILVGQRGKDGSSYDVGGGGGTFVAYVDNIPLIVAGGGGAKGNCGNNPIDLAQGKASNGTGNGGTGSNDGNYCGCGGAGSPGGGFYTDGGTDGSGKAFIAGGYGATGTRPGQCVDAGYGGFGGGGNGGNGGGGGGGYGGGDGGGFGGTDIGRGGSSYNDGFNKSGSDGVNNGDGSVHILSL